MSDRSLFPHECADRVPEPPKVSCCTTLSAPTGVPDRVWDLMHGICHGRVPFTLDGFTYVAGCTRRQASVAIRQAGQRDWLHVVWPEPYMVDPPEEWVGCLPKRR